MAKLLMARFDVYVNPGSHAQTTPYLLDVQSDLFEDLGSRVVIPMRRAELFGNIKLPQRLTPVFSIEGEQVVLETPKLGAVPSRVLKQSVTSLADAQDQITTALDFLFQGY